MKTIISLAIALLGFASQAASLTLAWDASTTTNVTYKIYQVDGVLTNQQTTATLQATFNNLLAGKTYSYFVIAVNSDGVESDPSNVLIWQVVIPLPAFVPQRTAALNVGGIWSFTVSWVGVTNKVPYGFTNYFVNVISKDSTNSLATPNTSLLVKGFPIDDYIIIVTASNANGPSPINNVLVLSKNPPSSPSLRIISSTP
jgi:hypothetical protein